jgi:hypothetical protein
MEQTDKEKRLQETARLYEYVLLELGQTVAAKIMFTARDTYATEDFVPQLCAALNGLTKIRREKLIYGNPKDKTARALADWWEEHEAADAARKLKDGQDKRVEALRKSGLAKLTAAERQALGLPVKG